MLRGRLIAIFTMLALALVALPAVADAKPGKFGSRVLKRGSHGKDVRVLQDYLSRAGFPTAVDGEFGKGTYRTVRSWEGSAELRVDGRVTRKDAKVLRRSVDAAPKAAPEAAAPPVETTATDPAEVDPAATGGAGFVQTVPTAKATVNADGTATPPADAPQVVQDIILAGNEIARKPYRYGGGHGNWNDSGYDCSGSVSYALHGAGLLKSALDSTSFMSWGSAGPGSWVSIYANPGHAYMTVAGLRFDTSAAKSGGGSRWTDEMRSGSGYTVRHPAGL